jgi:hypothetical protein
MSRRVFVRFTERRLLGRCSFWIALRDLAEGLARGNPFFVVGAKDFRNFPEVLSST